MSSNVFLFALSTFILTLCYFLFKYADGEYSVDNTLEIKRKTSPRYKINLYTGNSYEDGFITTIKYRITYKSGRIKFITKTHYHK